MDNNNWRIPVSVSRKEIRKNTEVRKIMELEINIKYALDEKRFVWYECKNPGNRKN